MSSDQSPEDSVASHADQSRRILAQYQPRRRAGMPQGERDYGASRSWRFTTVLWLVLCFLVGYLAAVFVYQAYGPSSAGVQWTTVRFSTANKAVSNSAGTPQQPLNQLQHIAKQLQQEVTALRNVSEQLHQQQQGQAQGRPSTGAVHYVAVQQQADSITAVGREISEQQTQLLQTITELRSALVTPQTQRARSAATATAGGQTFGVICTVLRNEAKYVSEWIAFHLLMGATQIVIYDDNSTDTLQSEVAHFVDAVDIIRLQDVPGIPGDTQEHRVASRQDWAFEHCKRNYASNSSAGWFGIWDVDEFVFPCMPPTSPGNMLWDAWTSSVKPGADAYELRCNRFGQNHEDQPQVDGKLVLLKNIRRAPDPLLEPTAAPLVELGTTSGCRQCGCCQSTSHKTIYDITRVSRLAVWTHGTHTQDAVIDRNFQRPYAGLCCNHYQFKSTKEAADKAQANLNSFYEKVATTPDAKKYYTMLLDTLIWRHLPNLLILLQTKGVEVNM